MNPNEQFLKRAEEILGKAQQKDTFYVLYVDFTDFHAINYIYGPKSGDVLLEDFEVFLLKLEPVRLCTRLFSDHFICLVDLTADLPVENAMSYFDWKAQEFLAAKQQEYPACKLKIACGISKIEENDVMFAIDGANIARKLSKLEVATKAILCSQRLREQMAESHEVEQELYHALQEKRFCFYLQPKVDLTSGRIVGAEALARRLGKDGEVIYPDSFLGSLEKSGQVIELDRMICRQVCEFLAERIRKNLPIICVSVNLSRLHIQNPESADILHSIVMEYGIPPEYLEFELTETILLKEFTGAKRLIDQLRAYGHRVSIDDFGSGYAGINIWQELNFDCLKLDQRFLSESEKLKQRNEAIVPNIIDIAQRLHVEVLCEGVETEAQCQYLLGLGCTIVQGFFFSKPKPAEKFFQIYEQQGGFYPLPVSLQPVPDEKIIPMDNKHPRKILPLIRPYFLVVLFCAAFLGLCIFWTMSVNGEMTRREFAQMVMETLNAYTKGQRENTLTEINGASNTLNTLRILIEQKDDPEFINAYLLALNKESSEVKYMYLSYEYFRAKMRQGATGDEDIKILKRLMKGETVVSDIMFSKRMGNVYCFAIGVPVFREGKFIGAVRGVIRADSLISTELYNPAQGQIVDSFLTDSDGNILKLRTDSDQITDVSLLEVLEQKGVKDSQLTELKEAYNDLDTNVASIYMGEFNDQPYYLSMADLEYNGWYLIVVLQADTAFSHSRTIVHNITYSIIGLLAVVLLTSAVIFFYFRRLQNRFAVGEQRYLLLEQFSDTVLFDYNCARDMIRFTPNANKLFRMHMYEQTNYFNKLNQQFIYAGDREIVREILSGETTNEVFRIRLMRPENGDYFWCKIQCKYIYNKGKRVSIIGKITDIDENMRHEKYLLHMSETDGLTGLRNKASTETQITEELKNSQEGTFILIDLDNFKQVNDQYGHATGDMVLRFVGETMQKVFRSGDVLGRIGGDELAAFMLRINTMETATEKAKQFLRLLKQGQKLGMPQFSASIGIAFCPEDGKTYEELFFAADHAMYQAKQEGKGQFCFFKDICVEDKNQENSREISEE